MSTLKKAPTLFSKLMSESPQTNSKRAKIRLETDVISEEITKSPERIWKIDDDLVKKSQNSEDETVRIQNTNMDKPLLSPNDLKRSLDRREVLSKSRMKEKGRSSRYNNRDLLDSLVDLSPGQKSKFANIGRSFRNVF